MYANSVLSAAKLDNKFVIAYQEKKQSVGAGYRSLNDKQKNVAVTSFVFKKFDFDLNLIGTLYTNYQATSIYAKDNQIYSFSADSSNFYVYGQDLILNRKIQLNVKLFVDTLIVMKYDRLFSYKNNEISIYDFKSQTCLKKMCLDKKYSNIGDSHFVYPISEDRFWIISRSGGFWTFRYKSKRVFIKHFSAGNVKNVLNFEMRESGAIIIFDSDGSLHIFEIKE